jgi:hypothetical protein
MSSSTANKPLELDAVMRSIRPHVKTPETPVRARAAEAASPAAAVEPSHTPAVEPAARAVEQGSASTFEPTVAPAPTAARKTRKPERPDNRVQVDLIPAAGEATVGVYMRLPKSVHQQLKTVVFQNELTEQGHQSIADITREAIAEWLARNRERTQAAQAA